MPFITEEALGPHGGARPSGARNLLRSSASGRRYRGCMTPRVEEEIGLGRCVLSGEIRSVRTEMNVAGLRPRCPLALPGANSTLARFAPRRYEETISRLARLESNYLPQGGAQGRSPDGG